jgi:hypothetical protein
MRKALPLGGVSPKSSGIIHLGFGLSRSISLRSMDLDSPRPSVYIPSAFWVTPPCGGPWA